MLSVLMSGYLGLRFATSPLADVFCSDSEINQIAR